MSRGHELSWEEYERTLQPHERPTMPGSPATPDHPWRRRAAYGATGFVVALTGSLGNAAVQANLSNLQGSLGITPVEAAWLPVVFVMTNACMNLILVKFRQQYGLRLFTQIFLFAFLAVSVAPLLFDDYASTLAVRAVAGMAAAGLSSLGFLYMIQALPAPHRLKALMIGIGVSGLAPPLARIIMPDLLLIDDWRGFYVFELGLVLVCLAATFSLKLPPSQRNRVFEPMDFVTFALFAPGVALLSAVLGLGRVVWWLEAPWIGWALVGSIVLLTAAVLVEFNRRNPLINLRWLAGPDMIRLGLAILIVRIVLAEQNTGALGFLQTMGLGPDQLRGLFVVILLATLAGTAAVALFVNPMKLQRPIAVALALIAVGALLDSQATVLTRVEQLWFSQALLAFAAAIFIGPAMLIGISNALKQGPQTFVSFIVVFSVGQNIGGLAGGALAGSVQVLREKFHSNQLAEGITQLDPLVVQRLQQLSGAYTSTIVDPVQRGGAGLKLLGQQVTQQANVLAYNDVSLMIAVMAAIGAVWMTFHYLRGQIALKAATAPVPTPPATAAGNQPPSQDQ
jgi:hypothetical protein